MALAATERTTPFLWGAAVLAFATAATVLAFTAPASAATGTGTSSATASTTINIDNKAVPRPGLKLQAAASGTFNIYNYNAFGKCIGIAHGTAGDFYCTTNPDQTWHWGAANSTGWKELVNGNGQCLAVAGGSTSAGASIIGYSCIKTADQYWALGSGFTQLFNYKGTFDTNGTGWVVGVAGGSTSNGQRLVLWWEDGTDNQLWAH